jgi:hypothetical protein
MKFCDSQLDNSIHELFERLEIELRGIEDLRLVDTAWLTCQVFRDRLEPILISVRARGGRVTHSSESIKNPKYV